MKSLLKTALITALALGTGGAAAETIPPSAGHGANLAKSAGSVFNTHPHLRRTLSVPLPLGSFGTKTVRVNAQRSSSSQHLSCRARANDSSGNFYNYGPSDRVSQLRENLTSTVYVPSGGMLLVLCSMDPFTQVHAVSY